MTSLEKIMQDLDPAQRKEITDFAAFLYHKYKNKKKRSILKQNWAGALKEYRDKYTSLKLEKKALEWRAD